MDFLPFFVSVGVAEPDNDDDELPGRIVGEGSSVVTSFPSPRSLPPSSKGKETRRKQQVAAALVEKHGSLLEGCNVSFGTRCSPVYPSRSPPRRRRV